MKNKKRVKILIGIAFILIIASCFIPNDDSKKNTQNPLPINGIRDSQAGALCKDYYVAMYENSTGFKAKTGWFSDYSVTENIDTWILRINGEVQNAFGTWIKVPAKCNVRKKSISNDWFDYGNIVHFEFEIK